MISYEIILSSAILIIILLSGSLNYITIIEIQQSIWFIVPLLPVFIFYFIAVLAETSRTPFDLQEAVVSGVGLGLPWPRVGPKVEDQPNLCKQTKPQSSK